MVALGKFKDKNKKFVMPKNVVNNHSGNVSNAASSRIPKWPVAIASVLVLIMIIFSIGMSASIISDNQTIDDTSNNSSKEVATSPIVETEEEQSVDVTGDGQLNSESGIEQPNDVTEEEYSQDW